MTTLNNFNAHEVDPMKEFDPVPSDEYPVAAIESEMKPTKASTGHYLELTFEIIEGEYQGRKLWSRLNLDNPNPKAVEIARAELSSICRAVGVMEPKNSTELHNIPLIAKVKCKKRKDTDEIVNEIKGYASKDSGTGKADASISDKAPWKRTGSDK